MTARWVSFSYTLPSGGSSSPRVALWRRLRRLGAISPAGGLYLLPAGDDATEAFTWLAQEIRAAGGEAYVGLIDGFVPNGGDAGLIERFREARGEDYAELAARAARAEAEIGGASSTDPADLRERLTRLRRRFQEIERLDFFGAPSRREAEIALERLAQRVSHEPPPAKKGQPLDLADYRDQRWVTRPRPHVDRLACAWFIRRFIDPEARIRYDHDIRAGEIGFDMAGAMFGHCGRSCSLETMIAAFGIDDPGLRVLAEIVHEIDLRDGASGRPEVEGVDAILRGWRAADFADEELERQGMALFEGLYRGLASGTRAASEDAPEESRGGGE